MKHRLANFKALCLDRPYEDGKWDCAMMIAYWAQLLEGRSYINEVGFYSSKLGGLRWMDSVCPGARTVAEITDFMLTDERWFRLRDEGDLKAGDLVEIENGGVCIWDGKSAIGLATGKTGYCVLSRSHVRAYWRFEPEEQE